MTALNPQGADEQTPPADPLVHLDPATAYGLAHRAILSVTPDEAVASCLAEATVAAELAGRSTVGFGHLSDYLEGFSSGRISSLIEPLVTFPAPASIHVDTRGGLAQLGFDRAFSEMIDRTRHYGVALLSLANCYTAGELGYYTRRLAAAGLVSLAFTNGPATAGPSTARTPVYGTNPISVAAPTAAGAPLVIDQSSTASAYVAIRQAAQEGRTLPEGWALDEDGAPTTEAAEALTGMLLPFAGPRGANIALIVELLAAGVTGADWSPDITPLEETSGASGAGLLVIALEPDLIGPGFAQRLSTHLDRLKDQGIYIPGQSAVGDFIPIASSLVRRLESYIG